MPSAAKIILAGLVDEAQVCAELGGLTARTIRNYEKLGLPVAVKRGRCKFYDPDAVRRWLMGESAPRRRGRPQKRR